MNNLFCGNGALKTSKHAYFNSNIDIDRFETYAGHFAMGKDKKR
jgi:hypothetical protein